tara:strand:+ start:577 stop:780 length:204 start_codon:yes stop_codon:yes gene_type:complete
VTQHLCEPRRYLTRNELAARWRVSRRTLERWAAEGYGPPVVAIGGNVRYRLTEIETWEARQTRSSRG